MCLRNILIKEWLEHYDFIAFFNESHKGTKHTYEKLAELDINDILETNLH
jgi:hypothetical protein